MITDCSKKNCAIIVGAFYATYVITKKLCRYVGKRKMLAEIRRKNDSRNTNYEAMKIAVFTNDAGTLEKRQNIIDMNFDALRSALQHDEITPSQVLSAFQWKALQVQTATNSVCEFLLEASDWANELEKKYQHSESKPPLYGIPMSFKECNFVKGHDGTMGMAQFVNQPADCDSEMVVLMRSLGAVPFVLTNVPQTMMSVGSSNPVFGICRNPHNPDLSSGGSSSGEAALIGGRGSVLGVGSDIGGSVRVPAHCCGIYSLKPTCGRLPGGGCRHPDLGISLVPATAGPMGADVDSLIWFYRSVWHPATVTPDPTVPPLYFREDVLSDQSKLTIGYYDDDGYVTSTPATRRAVRLARETLESLGHTLVPFQPPNVRRLMALYAACVLPDGGSYLGGLFRSDFVTDRFHKNEVSFLCKPIWMKKFLAFASRPFCRQASDAFGSFAGDLREMRRIFSDFAELKAKFVQSWTDTGLDCVLCPVMASTALTPEVMAQLYIYGWNYTALYNALNFPAGVLPCIMTNEQDDRAMQISYKPNDRYSKLIKRSFESSRRKSVPVGVQLVALPYREELCLRIMKELDIGLKMKNV